MENDILSRLTSSQKQAVTWGEGPLLVLAGPGSGKTRVIAHRVAYLIEMGISPHCILALTFTNKAADEMRSRLQNMRIPEGSLICTFHSLCARLLREFSHKAGLAKEFSIFDRSDQLSVIRHVLKEMDLDPQAWQPPRLLHRISRWKNERLTSGRVLESVSMDSPSAVPARIYEEYQRRVEKNAAADFDDLLMKTENLLENHPDIRKKLNQRFRYILVDEYQDTNPCQFRIARSLSCEHRNLFVTGDPDQSIYGWRGADIKNILAFEKDFPEAEVVRLEDNFRSTPPILNLADGMIRANEARKSKRLIARIQGGSRPRLFSYADEHEEAEGAAAWVREMRSFNFAYRDLAVFYRVNAMSRVLEETFHRKKIPYQIVRGLEFYQRREIKDMLAYLRIIVNPSDQVSLFRIINRPPRGIGEKTREMLQEYIRETGSGIGEILSNPESIPGLYVPAAPRLDAFADLIRKLQGRRLLPAAELIRLIYERSGYRKHLEKSEHHEAVQNIQELISGAEEYDRSEANPDAAGYLHRIALISDPDTYNHLSGAVSLMTLHAAKGLEFPAVLITGVENEILPHSLSRGTRQGLEEERRLLFVGITRAKKHLALSYARSRSRFGAPRPSGISPFLQGVQGLMANGSSVRHKSPEIEEPRFSGYEPGKKVLHPRLGKGVVQKVIPGKGLPKLVVLFSRNRRLTLDLNYAELDLLD